MTSRQFNTWQDVQSEVLSRINSRRWKPGDLIPNEVDLAVEFGCARATVNRALRAVADSGFLDRRRKAGTRVALHPVRKATLSIPIIRQEIEAKGQTYAHTLLSSEVRKPADEVARQMKLSRTTKALHLTTLHLADGHPHASEDRWINVASVPQILNVDLDKVSANEWLVENAPFTNGDISFSAVQADKRIADVLAAKPGDALFVIDRITWDRETAITLVRLTFHRGYQMRTTI